MQTRNIQITRIELRLIIHGTGLSLVCSHTPVSVIRAGNRLPPEASGSRDVERALWSMNQGLARPDGPRATEGISKCSASFFQAPRCGQASWTGRQMKSANGLPESIIQKKSIQPANFPLVFLTLISASFSPHMHFPPLPTRSPPSGTAGQAGQALGGWQVRSQLQTQEPVKYSRSEWQKRPT